MPADDIARPWAIRSTLIAVADLERSVAFYRELGPSRGSHARAPSQCSVIRRPRPSS